LTYPIGLITADETAIAGLVNGKNNLGCYINNSQYYWTMSPYSFSGATALVFVVYSSGNLHYGNHIASMWSIRPVINLRSDVKITGTGIISDPYIVN